MPASATPDQRALAQEALDVVVSVMRGEHKRGARERLSAATAARAIAGLPVPTRAEHTGANAEPVQITITRQAPDPDDDAEHGA